MSVVLSVIIPAFNEASALPDCLKSLKNQLHAPPHEIIIVDNNSTDATAAIAQSSGVRVISEQHAGVCFARNAGLQAAKGQIIISTDADCTYPPDWLARIGQAFADQPDLQLLSGNYRFKDAPYWSNTMLGAYEWLCLQVNYAFGWLWFVSAANLAFRKSAFPAYDTRLTQGGDELYVMAKIKPQGRVLYRFSNPVMTSGRRLHQGFIKTFFRDFLGAYIINYWHTRLTGKNAAGTYGSHRRSSGKGVVGKSFSGPYLIMLLLVVVLAWVEYQAVLLLGSLYPGQLPLQVAGGIALALGVVSYACFNPHSQLAGPQPFRARTKRKVVALTFDDGPNGEFTVEIAKIIEQYDGRASFFQVGENVLKQPEVTKALFKRGHLIGSHSMHHAYRDFFKPGWRQNITDTTAAIVKATGQAPVYARLPWLFRTPWLLHPLYENRLQPVAGTFVSLPEFRQPNGVRMAQRFASKVKPGDILIMHDGYNAVGGDRTQTVNAVKELCKLLHARGFQFVRLDALI